MIRSQYLILPEQMGVREVQQFSAGGFFKAPVLMAVNRIVHTVCDCPEGHNFCLHLQMVAFELEGPNIPKEKVSEILEHYKNTMKTTVLAIGKTKLENSGRIDLLIECETQGVELWGYHRDVLVHMYFSDKYNFEKEYARLK